MVTELIRAGGLGGGLGSILYSDQTIAPTTGEWEGFIYNAVGSTAVVANSSGTPTQRNEYEAFGTTITQTGNSTNNRLRNTKERDTSIGLDNDGFRYYDPETARYIQRDPIGYGDGLNVYRHVTNNPINKVDPQGLSAWDLVKEVGARAASRAADAVVNRARAASSYAVAVTAAGMAATANAAEVVIPGKYRHGWLQAAPAMVGAASPDVQESFNRCAQDRRLGTRASVLANEFGISVSQFDALNGFPTVEPLDQENYNSAYDTAGYIHGGMQVGAAIGGGGVTPEGPSKKITLDGDRFPQSAAHLEEAGVAGRPLTVNRQAARANRAEALRGIDKVSGKDLDEAPPAFLRGPGEDTSVRPLDRPDNRGAGASIGNQARDVADGGTVIIEVKRGPGKK